MKRLCLWITGLSLGACAPGEDELRALGTVRFGQPARTVPISVTAPPATAEACCCPADKRWFDLATPPVTCEVFPEAVETDRLFRGTTYLDGDCLLREGFLEQRELSRRTVSCDTVCGGKGTTPDQVGSTQVLVPTEKLVALREHDLGGSWDLRVGEDHLGPVLERTLHGLSEVSVIFQILEDTTALEPCVVEGRSRAPGMHRKASYTFKRVDGEWK